MSIKINMFAQTLVWAAGAENISLAWLGLVAAKLARLGWLLGWLGSGGLRLLELAGWLLDGMHCNASAASLQLIPGQSKQTHEMKNPIKKGFPKLTQP